MDKLPRGASWCYSAGMRKRALLVVAAAAVACLPIHAEEQPDYRTLILRNALLPGTAQLALGDTAEGIVYLAALPLQLVGLGLVTWQLIETTQDAEIGLFQEEGRTYFIREADPSRSAREQWLYYGGMTLSLYGNLLAAYSQYAAYRDYVDRWGDPWGALPVRSGRESLPLLLASPWLPRNALSADVLAGLALTAAGSLGGGDFARIGEFFRRETVPFMGSTVTPAAGLGLRLATAILLVTANSLSEEILFRGIWLEQAGETASSLTFGLAHLSNALLPGTAIEDTLLQTAFATGFGFYAARSTVSHGYNLERMAAFHFWNNVLAFTLGYLLEPESQGGLCIGFRTAL